MSDAIAPDGSPVEFYARLPAADEPAIIHAALPAGATILELGCGAGRVTHALTLLGHPVTAVDESADMLTHVQAAETVCSTIESLDLGRRFSGVVLASHLINRPDPAQRQAFLGVCRRHVADDGVVIIERHDPRWATSVLETSGEWNGVRSTLRDISHDGPFFSAVMDYAIGPLQWTQSFTARILSDEEMVAALRGAGLALRRWLDADRKWLAAAPARLPAD
ncbi:MAG: class I SAM-dependent methyltransferase [Dehalococcoidia bacterium]